MKIQRFKTREEWLANRRNCLGGSEIAAVLGMSPYPDANPMSVWLTKMGKGQEREVTPAMEWGSRHEAALKQKFAENHPEFKLAGLGPYDVITMDDFPWASCTPDDLIGDDGILETKAPGWRQAYRWGDQATDEAPTEYLLQCQWNMGVACRRFCYLVPLIGGSDYREYPLVADQDLMLFMLDAANRFWHDHVLTGKPPDLDGSEATRDYLASKYPTLSGEVPVVTEANALTLLDEFATLEYIIKQGKERLEVLKNRVIDLIGSNDGVIWPGGKITYKRPKDSEITDWKAAFAKLEAEFVESLVLATKGDVLNTEDEAKAEGASIARSIVKDHTTTRVNSRRFLPTIKEGYVRQIESASTPELPAS